MNKKLSFASVFVISLLAVVLLVFFSLSSRPFTTNAIGLFYSLGEEVEDYPISELNTSFTSWNMTTRLEDSGFQLDPGNDSLLVLVNFTLRNTTNKTINLFDQHALATLSSRHIPSLSFEGQTPDGEYVSGYVQDTQVGGSWLNRIRLGDPVLFSGIMNANQTAEGLLVYMLPKGCGASGLEINYSANLEIFVELVNLGHDDSLY